jgi:hypothetical protein
VIREGIKGIPFMNLCLKEFERDLKEFERIIYTGLKGIFATDLCSPNSQQDNSKPTQEHGHSPTTNLI